MVILKKGQEAFTIVDGPDKGKTFKPNTEYEKAPKGYEKRFSAVKLNVNVKPKISSGKGKKS